MVDKVTAIREVQTAVEFAMAAAENYIRTSVQPTSEETRAVIEEVLLQHQCESVEGVIVASGPASFEPHEVGSGVILLGQPVVIDIFPRSKETGYFADMTRTICIGEASADLIAMYEAVQEAQELAMAMVAPGVRGSDIHNAVWNYFMSRGYETSGKGTLFAYAEGFVHSLGHGVGQAIHESPRLSSKSDDVLQVGDVITIEPGLYYRHIGGVRLEDIVVVTEDGCRNLTTYKKRLL